MTLVGITTQVRATRASQARDLSYAPSISCHPREGGEAGIHNFVHPQQHKLTRTAPLSFLRRQESTARSIPNLDGTSAVIRRSNLCHDAGWDHDTGPGIAAISGQRPELRAEYFLSSPRRRESTV